MSLDPCNSFANLPANIEVHHLDSAGSSASVLHRTFLTHRCRLLGGAGRATQSGFLLVMVEARICNFISLTVCVCVSGESR